MLPKLMKMVEGKVKTFLSGKTTEHRDYMEGRDDVATYEDKEK